MSTFEKSRCARAGDAAATIATKLMAASRFMSVSPLLNERRRCPSSRAPRVEVTFAREGGGAAANDVIFLSGETLNGKVGLARRRNTPFNDDGAAGIAPLNAPLSSSTYRSTICPP